ncbi:unnamed protein product [Sphenostylis stenocarpa]|uniref:Uncharacterized protein n=1 Tax=Sphenostylis stenocarpa TaxID=92480 RepID=A0AA86VDT8_9FABA|nr:unnamed protein product [Sphenostylis stenocarpa]
MSSSVSLCSISSSPLSSLLFTSFPLNPKCLFRSRPFDPIQPSSLFPSPSSYGQHKYAISTPLNFSDYWDVLKEIQNLRKNPKYCTRN